MHRPLPQTGVTLIEVVLGVSIVALMVVTIGFSVNAYVNARTALLDNMKATYLAEDGYEIIRALRDTDWNTIDALSVNTLHYLSVSTSTIAATTTPEVIDTKFRRSFVLRNVYRNGSDDIVASTTVGATIDDGVRSVEIYVSSPNGTTSLEAILANVHAI